MARSAYLTIRIKPQTKNCPDHTQHRTNEEGHVPAIQSDEISKENGGHGTSEISKGVHHRSDGARKFATDVERNGPRDANCNFKTENGHARIEDRGGRTVCIGGGNNKNCGQEEPGKCDGGTGSL
jgi:hypothetical protein